MFKKTLILFMCSILVSCSTWRSTPLLPEEPEKEKKFIDHIYNPLDDFPASYNLRPYSRKPIIDSVGNNYIVSDEFVENSILLKKYNDKVIDWKNKHKIK